MLGIAKKGEDCFTDNGFDNWKKAHEKFSQHAQSSLHKEAVLKMEQLKQDSVHTLLCRHALSDQKLQRYAFEATINAEILTLTRNGYQGSR